MTSPEHGDIVTWLRHQIDVDVSHGTIPRNVREAFERIIEYGQRAALEPDSDAMIGYRAVLDGEATA